MEYSSWSFATHLRPKTASLLGDAEAGNRSDARRSWPLLSDSEVIEAVRAGMLRFRSAGSASGDRLSQTTVTDYVFSPPGHEAYGQEPAALQVINLADEEVRHFLGIRVGGWDEDPVTSTFVRPSTHGDILYLEVVVRVLAPVRRRYRIPVEPTAAGVHPNALLAIPGDLRRAMPRQALRTLRSWRPVMGPDRDEPDGRDHPAFRQLRHRRPCHPGLGRRGRRHGRPACCDRRHRPDPRQPVRGTRPGAARGGRRPPDHPRRSAGSAELAG